MPKKNIMPFKANGNLFKTAHSRHKGLELETDNCSEGILSLY